MKIGKKGGVSTVTIGELEIGAVFLHEDGDYYIKTDEMAVSDCDYHQCVDIVNGILMNMCRSNRITEMPYAIFYPQGHAE